MAQINFTIPDAMISRVLDAFAVEFGWTTATGLTKAQFTKQKITEYIKSVVRKVEAEGAAQAARQAATSDIETNITIS